nr:IclR family transcriptional regulator C-terminal domain-containing protein [Massilia sp. Mn16-1_5]
MTSASFVTSLARGLAVIQAFTESCEPQTMALISKKTGIPRAAVRRCLYTLRQLNYVEAEQNNFTLSPKVLSLGHSYFSATPLTILSQPYLDSISRELGESCSLAVLDGDEVLYVARSAAPRVMTVGQSAGSRLPAYCTSLGRVMLAYLSPKELDAYLAQVHMKAMTSNTVNTQKRLRKILLKVRETGYAINDEEYELGLRSIAVPIIGTSGEIMAALNVGTQASLISIESMREKILPVLLRGAQEISLLLR